MTTATKTIVMYGHEVDVEPRVGRTIQPDGWDHQCTWLTESDWDEAAFRMGTNCGGPITSIAVNITVTGRTVQERQESYWVRVQIEAVGDGEPSTFWGGWMEVATPFSAF